MSEHQKARLRAFFWGFGSVLDLSGRSVIGRATNRDMDRVGIDFRRVGEDLAAASEEAEPELEQERTRQLPLPLHG